MTPDADSRRYPTFLLFALLFLAVFVLHLPLLRLPYFWDEAGYYVPAARDLFLSGSLIPYSTPSNAHPPLVLAYVALAWKALGYAPIITRTAMLGIAAFGLAGVFRLAERVANREVALASTVCTALYPVFFAQSTLAHLDLAAAAFTFWGLLAYVEERPWATAIWFSFAVLAKETAILAPLALFMFDIGVRRIFPTWSGEKRQSGRKSFWLLLPVVPLGLWYAYHWHRTGFIFGNPEFLRYNVQDTLRPIRILLALGLRLWQVLAYMGMYLLTLTAVAACWFSPLSDKGKERARIDIHVQLSFSAVILTYVVVMAVIGGAVLARYVLPVVPLVIIVFVSTLHRRMRYWRAIVAFIALGFVLALFVNPSYGFSFEDNLAYRDYIVLHQHAENFLEGHYAASRLLTAWPASDEVSRAYLGYITRPIQIVRIEDFSAEQLADAAKFRSNFDVALVFSTKYEPSHPWLGGWGQWQQWKREYFGYHRDLPPSAAANNLDGQLVYEEHRGGQWVGVIVLRREAATASQ